MRSIAAMLVIASLLLVSGCKSAPPLPSDLVIVEPDADVAPQRAAFIGKWEGKWDGRSDARLVVEQIVDDRADVVYAWGASAFVEPDFQRYEAHFDSDNTLIFETAMPVVYRFRLLGDDTLDARATWKGGLSRGKFVRTPDTK